MLLLLTFILLLSSPLIFTCILQMRSVILLVINEYDDADAKWCNQKQQIHTRI